MIGFLLVIYTVCISLKHPFAPLRQEPKSIALFFGDEHRIIWSVPNGLVLIQAIVQLEPETKMFCIGPAV